MDGVSDGVGVCMGGWVGGGGGGGVGTCGWYVWGVWGRVCVGRGGGTCG